MLTLDASDPKMTTPRRDLLLVAADLEERRLLYAQLLEAGYEVLPLPGLTYAVEILLLKLAAPPLILLDTQGDERATPELVQQLLAIAPGTPLIVVVSRMTAAAWEPLRPRLAALLIRPISIGEIVETVGRLFTSRQASAHAGSL